MSDIALNFKLIIENLVLKQLCKEKDLPKINQIFLEGN